MFHEPQYYAVHLDLKKGDPNGCEVCVCVFVSRAGVHVWFKVDFSRSAGVQSILGKSKKGTVAEFPPKSSPSPQACTSADSLVERK